MLIHILALLVSLAVSTGRALVFRCRPWIGHRFFLRYNGLRVDGTDPQEVVYMDLDPI